MPDPLVATVTARESTPSSAASAPAGAAAFVARHVGPRQEEVQQMLALLGCASLEELVDSALPADIRVPGPLVLDEPLSEQEALERLRAMADQNQVFRSMIGMGYYGTHTPPVIQRNILENPLWYTPYTPYQSEISQGRLEALLNFQTMVSDLTAMDVANASLLDEATAAAEAMAMCHGIARGKKPAFYAADDCHPQTLAVLRTRAWSMGIELRIGPAKDVDLTRGDLSGILLQYPATDGRVEDYASLIDRAHQAGALAVVATDLLALTLLKPPGQFGADIVVGSAQRFGVPMGYGGPHAAFLATRESYVRRMPGRLVGVSKDAQGRLAYRLAVQTREQHIKRERATSNICTAQVLLAVMAGMYAVWHGPEGLTRIAQQVHRHALELARGLQQQGYAVPTRAFFDTITVQVRDARALLAAARDKRINLRYINGHTVGISCDETTTDELIDEVLEVFRQQQRQQATAAASSQADALDESDEALPASLRRVNPFLAHPVFHRCRSEAQMMRYITQLQRKDISLAQAMIPLGSCTMKLNAAAEMMPVSWPKLAHLHPYAPRDQARGYAQLLGDLKRWLAAITGLPAVSLQPNAGSQGEYAGLLAIRRYHLSRGQGERDVCLIPTSAHGTNPASAVVAGLRVVPVACDEHGNVDVQDLERKAAEHAPRLAALMITYPSTHGVFEPAVRQICRIVHEHGGQVYMDGANMNAQVGLTQPGLIGADVVHLNLHKTFCIPHGGGGPGAGPIAAAAHLAPFLPGEPTPDFESQSAEAASRAAGQPDQPASPGAFAIAAAPYGSPLILPISWMYIAMMGGPGLTRATQMAILNANYMAHRLQGHYPVLYRGPHGRVAHEFILDCRAFEKSAGVTVEDIAKRLIDYGFHAPTMSWPVPGTLMIEPTESEPKEELDRLCDALIAIRQEIRDIEEGRLDRQDNPLKHAPHPAHVVAADDWPHQYPRQRAAYPVASLLMDKYWPPVSRVDNPYGDRNLMCLCPPVEEAGSLTAAG
ncbi:MAG TPA: aminomethyl-transferring glycine dehydrogenase [Phycisphaeraceae bacterium]